MEQDIINYIEKELINDKTNEALSPETDLLGSGLIDSMGVMLLIQHIEGVFNIKVEPENMTIENFISVDAMVEFITNQQNNNG